MMSELIDRYVRAVGRRLPKKQRADVQEELRSTLLDTLEARVVEGEPGEEDVVALLREFGKPEEVAAKYRPGDQYLIGPELFPLFRLVLTIVLAATAGGLTLGFLVNVAFNADSLVFGTVLGDYLSSLISAVLSGAGSVVIVFAILQRLDVRPTKDEKKDWNPRDLPDVTEAAEAGRGEAIASVVSLTVFMILLNVFRDKIGLVMVTGSEVKPLLNDLFLSILPWINASLGLGIALHSYLLWRGRWDWYTRVAKVAIDLFGLYVFYRFATLFADSKPVLLEAGLGEPLASLLTQLFYWLVLGAAVGVAIDLVKVVLRYAREGRFPLTFSLTRDSGSDR